MNPDDNNFRGKSIYKSGCGLPNVHFSPELVQREDLQCRKTTSDWIIAGTTSNLPSLLFFPIPSYLLPLLLPSLLLYPFSQLQQREAERTCHSPSTTMPPKAGRTSKKNPRNGISYSIRHSTTPNYKRVIITVTRRS